MATRTKKLNATFRGAQQERLMMFVLFVLSISAVLLLVSFFL